LPSSCVAATINLCMGPHLIVVVNRLAEFLCGRRVSARDRGSDVGNLVHNTPQMDSLIASLEGKKR
jgi:hypothetical protein